MTYMIPIRRASAAGLPAASVANAAARKVLASLRSAGLSASRTQSTARPSLCSEAPEPEQGRFTAPPVPPYVATSHSPRATVPARGFLVHVLWGSYDA